MHASHDALKAFMRNQDTEEAMIGGMMLVEGLSCLRVLRDFALGIMRGKK